MTNTFLPNPGRRFFLQAGAASIWLTVHPGQSFAKANVVTRRPVGSAEVITVSDGQMKLPLSFLFPDAKPEDVAQLFKEGGLSLEPFATPPVNVAFIRHGGNLIAVDCGAGGNFMEGAGKLPEGLSQAGIVPEDVTHVILTHAHPDHLWGAIDDFEDTERFPNAKHVIATREWDYWMASDLLDRTPEASKGMAAGTQRILKRLEARLERVAPTAQIVGGITLVPTPGHTPGHSSVMVEDGKDKMLVLGDALSHPLASFQTPDWVYGPDLDSDMAIKTRKSLLAMLATEKLQTCGYHLPSGGFGTVKAHGGSYHWLADLD